jgi:hypothetical protein
VSEGKGAFRALDAFLGGAQGDGSGHAADFALDYSSYLSED